MKRIFLGAISSASILGGLAYGGVFIAAFNAPVETYQGPTSGEVQSSFLGKTVIAGNAAVAVTAAADKKSLVLTDVPATAVEGLRQATLGREGNGVILPSDNPQDLRPVILNSAAEVTPEMERTARASFAARQRIMETYYTNNFAQAGLAIIAGIVGLSIARKR